jgi:hypothetical protein
VEVQPGGLATKTLAEIYLAQGHRDKALQILEQILQRNPGRDDIRQQIAALKELPDIEAGSGAAYEDLVSERAGEAGGPEAEGTPTGAPADPAKEVTRFKDWLARIRQQDGD